MKSVKLYMIKVLRRVINSILVLLILVFIVIIVNKKYSYYKENLRYNKIRNIRSELVKQNDNEVFIDDEMKKINSDYVFWIEIPDTVINYPVVQGVDNQFYLNNNFYGEESISGTIFLDAENDLASDRNLILYGHHMRDGSMFAGINKFKEEDFFDNGKIKIIKDNKEYFYEVFSVRVVDGNDNKIISHFNNDEEFDNYIELLKTESIYKKDEINSDFSKIITLFTCSYEFDNARTIISAALVE